MSVKFDSNSGISVDSTSTIRNNFVTQYKQVFSTEENELNTDPEAPAGQLIDSHTAVEARKDSELLYLMNMFNPATAEGIFQDALGAIYNITRKQARATVVNCRCYGAQGVTIPKGAIVQAEFGTNRYQLVYNDEAVTIPARNSLVSNAYIVSTATALSSNWLADSQTKATAGTNTPTNAWIISSATELSTSWLAASQADAEANPPVPMTPTFGATYKIQTTGSYKDEIFYYNGSSYEAMIDRVFGDVYVVASTDSASTGYTGKIYYWNGTAWELSTGTFVDIDFDLTETGAISIGVGAVNTIITVIPGWDSVYNFTAGVTGRAVESRADFETRRYNSVAMNAHGSAAAVSSNLKDLDGVIDCKCYDNRTSSALSKDGISITAHSVAVCIKGGEDEEIAEVIYNKLGGGCGTSTDGSGSSVTNQTVTYTDEDGTVNTYNIIRPADKNIYVKVQYRATGTTPSNVGDLIKAAVKADFNGEDENSGNSRVGLGQTLYASRFSVAVIKTAGVNDLVGIKVGENSSTITSDSVDIDANEEPVLADVVVQLVTGA